jgi:hypothetical protein
MAPKKPVVIITLHGQKPELQSVLLTSHMDVVPVYPVGTINYKLYCSNLTKRYVNMKKGTVYIFYFSCYS